MQDTFSSSPELVGLLFSCGFLLFWCAVSYLVSFGSGWKKLASQYPKRSDAVTGKKFMWRSMRLGIANYNNSVNYIVAPAGLYISTVAIFRFGHESLMIPWSMIERVSKKSLAFFSWYEIHISNFDSTAHIPNIVIEEAMNKGYIQS